MGLLDRLEALPGGVGQREPQAKGLGLGETGCSGRMALLAPCLRRWLQQLILMPGPR